MQQHIKNKLLIARKCKLGMKIIPGVSVACFLGLCILCLDPPVDTNNVFAKGDNGDDGINLQTEAPDASISFIMTNNVNETVNDGGTVTTETKLNDVSFIDTNIKVTTNKIKQFHVAIQSVDSNTNLVGESADNTIATIGSKMLPANFKDDTWGYAVAETSSDNASTEYNPLSSSNDSSASYSSALNPADGEHDLKLSFAAKTNMYTPSDHYKITTVVSVVAQAKELVEYSLSYNANGGLNPPSSQTMSSVAESYTFTIASPGSMTREGYSFLGWSVNSSSTTAEYAAGSTITLTNVAPTKTLYAVWKEDIKTFNNIVYMQDMTTAICKDSSVTIGSTRQLKDKRDSKYYWIAKLADGNCWMTQNLDFDIPTRLNTGGAITSDIDTANFTTNTTKVTTLSDWDTNTATYNAYYDPGNYVYNGPSNPAHGQGNSCNTSTGLSECITKYSGQWATTGDTHYHVGNYYSFSAATVKSGDSLDSGSTPNSICPKGWKLPSGFYGLLSEYKFYDNSNVSKGDYAIYKTPLYFVYGGYIGSSKLNRAGSYGGYWSSTVFSSGISNHLSFDETISTAGRSAQYAGYSVRCVAR